MMASLTEAEYDIEKRKHIVRLIATLEAQLIELKGQRKELDRLIQKRYDDGKDKPSILP